MTVKTIHLFIAMLLRALIGTWQPPAWAGWITRKTTAVLRRYPRAIGTLTVLGLAAYFGHQQWQKWWLLHQPQPRVLVEQRHVSIRVEAPSGSVWHEEKLVPSPLFVRFSENAAPLEAVGKPVEKGISLQPAVPGAWKWSDAKTLTFTPTAEYLAGTAYTITWEKSLLPSEVSLDNEKLTFNSFEQKVSINDYVFYTQPDRPEIHQLTATLRSVYPATQEAMRAVIDFSPLKTEDGTVAYPTPNFTLTAGKDPFTWYFRTDALKIPEVSQPMKLGIKAGLPSISGGAASLKEVVAKTDIPDKYSALDVKSLRPMIVKNSQGEPKQMLSVTTSIPVKANELTTRLKVYRLASSDDEFLMKEDRSAFAVTPEMLSRATAVKFEMVLGEENSPFSTEHTVQFFSPNPGRMVVIIDANLPGLGGFEMRVAYRDFVTVPLFPIELEWTGKGNILALEGERKIQFKSRGVDFIKLTLGRVRAGELNHLITQNDYGDFSEPSLDGAFSKDSLVRSQYFIVRVDKKNDWDACYTSFDLSAALAKADPSDPDPSRGVFFVSATSVRPTLNSPEPDTVLSRVEDSSDYYYEDYDVSSNSESGEPPHTLLDHTGSAASLSDWFAKMGAKESITWGEGNLASKRFVMITDLGTLIKTNADGSRDAFVMSIKQQVPVAGARVKVIARNGEILQEVLTDATGRANLSKVNVTARESQPVACTVALGQDTSFIPLRPGQLPSMDYSRYSVDGVMSSRTQAVEAQVFTERGVYRPGDEIHFAAVVRRRDWQAVIEGLPIRAVLTDSEGVNVAELQMKLPRDGFFEGKLKTSESNATGVYELKLYVLNMEMKSIEFMLGRTALRVEDFRPDRMKMKVDMQPVLAKGWVKPEERKARVTLTNLFGIVAAERKVKGVIELSAGDFSFPAWDGYQFSAGVTNDADSSAGKTIELGEVVTDASGVAEMVLPLAGIGKANVRAQLNLEAFETDGGHGVRDSQSFLLSPWDYVVGFKSDVSLDYVGRDTSAAVKWIALSPQAEPIAVTGLTYRLSQRKVISVLRKQDNGSMVYQSENREVIVRDEAGKSWSTDPTTLPLDTTVAGDFIFSVLNEAGETLCRCSYSVIGKGNQQRQLDRDAELVVKPSKSRVNAGDTIELSIVAPYKGAGLITLEREKVLYAQWFQADTNATVQTIRIPEGMDGTVYCNVSFVRSLESSEIMMSPLSYAAVPITIAPTQHEMRMEIDAPQVVKPGDTLKIGYRTDDPSRVIIYAVDEGIHQITRYQRPQPLDFFYRKQALEVRTQQWFDLLIPEYRFLHQNAAFGGDGDGGLESLSLQLNPFKRKRDAPVVYWAGIVAADTTRKELTWVVPDYFAGSLNIMAVAVNEQKISGAETKTLVRSPLILTVNAPVHAAPGDEFVASLTVTNNTDQPGPAEVEVTLQPSSNLQVMGDAVMKLTIDRQREATCRFRVKTLDSLGNADLLFLATSGAENARRTETLSVRPSGPFRSAVRSSYVRTKTNDEAITRSLYEAYRRGEVSASPLPVVLAGGLQQYMEAYPHGCTEQITSKAMTLLTTREIKGLKLALTEDEIQQRLLLALGLLQQRQAPDGGFGYWDSRSSSGFFLSCYVSHFLLECKEASLPVPASMQGRALGYLRKIADGAEPRSLEDADLQAYAVYLLLRQGQRTNGLAALRETLDRVFKDQWQDRLCGSLMASSYLLLQKKSDAEAISKRWGKSKAVVYQNGVYYWNRAEVDQLLSFALRARHFPDVVKNYGYAEWKNLYGVLWEQRFNTLTASYAALGMREFSKLAAQAKFGYEIFAQAKGSKDFVSLVKSSETLTQASFSRDIIALRFVLDQGDSDLGLFYQVVEDGFDAVEPTTIVRDGIEVFRELLHADGSKVTSMKVGDTVNMKLRIRNVSPDSLGNIALIDLLPSGFVIEPGAMQPGSGTVAGTERADLREDRNLFYLSLPKAADLTIQYHIRAVCAGDFVVPALFAESMYDRGINGRGLSQRVKVESNP